MNAYRQIVAERIGRPLRPDERVHHINGNRDDNSPENLLLVTAKQHVALHNMTRKTVAALKQAQKHIALLERKLAGTEDEPLPLGIGLVGATEAAKILGTTPTTLYRWVAQGRVPHRPESWGLCFNEEDLARANPPRWGRPPKQRA